MKNIYKILTFIIIIFSPKFHTQIQKIEVTKCDLIGKISPGMHPIKNEKCGDSYKITYSDIKYRTINVNKSFDFKDVDNAYEYLFTTIDNAFKDNPTDIIWFNLPNDYVGIKFGKILGVSYFSFVQAVDKNSAIVGSSDSITKKQFYKLFGKK